MTKTNRILISAVTIVLVWLGLLVISSHASSIQGDVVFGGSNLGTAAKIPFVSSNRTITIDPNADAFEWDPPNNTLNLGTSVAVGKNTLIKLSTGVGLNITNNSTAQVRFLPSGNDVFYQSTSTTGNIFFTGNNGAFTSGAVDFRASALDCGFSNGTAPCPIQSLFPVGTNLSTIRSIFEHGGNGAGINSLGGVQIAAQGQNNSTLGSGAIHFLTPTGNSGADGTDATLADRVIINQIGTLQFTAYGAGALTTDASGNVTAVSDERLKYIQRPFTDGLQQISKLRPIVYKWRPESKLETQHEYAGFSAQNVKQFIPEAVGQDPSGHLTLQDRPIEAALVNAVQELSAQVKYLQARVSILEAKQKTVKVRRIN